MKIRVLKDLPWAKVGEVVELIERVDLKSMEYKNWIEFVEEKKTLEMKLVEAGFGECSARHAIEICRQHFLEALPKKEEQGNSWLKVGIDKCRKAIEGTK